jgi:hypothetical protein
LRQTHLRVGSPQWRQTKASVFARPARKSMSKTSFQRTTCMRPPLAHRSGGGWARGAERAIFTPESGPLRANNPRFLSLSPCESGTVRGPTPEGADDRVPWPVPGVSLDCRFCMLVSSPT